MRSLTVHPVVYVLLLEGDDQNDCYYYIGSTHNLNFRLSQHMVGLGANFTKLHAFKSIVEVRIVTDKSALDVENELTLEYQHRFGYERVRGGKYTRV